MSIPNALDCVGQGLVPAHMGDWLTQRLTERAERDEDVLSVDSDELSERSECSLCRQ